MKKIFMLNLLFITFLTNFNPAYSISPDVFIQSTVNRASQVLSKNISKQEKIDKLKIIDVSWLCAQAILKQIQGESLQELFNNHHLYEIKLL